MSLGLQIAGDVAKRGLIRRLPTGDRLLDDIEGWVRNAHGDVLRSAVRRSLPSDVVELRLDLHPAAPPVIVTADAPGRIAVAADTEAVGPGYRTFVARLMQRLGEEIEIAWGTPDPTGAETRTSIPSADRPEAEREYLEWLGRWLVACRDERRRGRPGVQVGLPDGVRYTFDGALATMLGPRGETWLAAALADPRAALDVTPWWADATDARYLLNRTLCLLWTEVRWRPPAADGEPELLDEACRLLARAFQLDPGLPYPWREWHELLVLRASRDPLTAEIARRASRVPQGATPIGYRRRPVTILLNGWALDIPGSFAERRDGDEWTGTDAGRTISLAAVTTGTAAGPMAPVTFLAEVTRHLGSAVLEHRAGELLGRARLSSDGSSGIEVGVLEGYSAVRGSGAAIRVDFEDPNDWQWAVDTWRGLRTA